MRLFPLLLIALSAATGGAQEVTGSVRAGAQGTPVAGAIVILISSSNVRVGGTLTDDAGRYRLRAPDAGRFSLRVDVVGYRSVTVPPFTVDAGAPITRDIRFTFERTQLPAVAITASSSCARVIDESGDAPQLWNEARKTLEASRLAIDERRFNVALRRHERTIGIPDSVLRASRTWTQTAVSVNPFESLSPEEIASNGFFARQDSSRLYYAPDAKVLLSDLFVNSHCFGTRRGGPGGAVGLTFRPQRGSERVDISGVLWIDSASAELRSLEYRYQPALSRREPGGGTVAFGRYPSGVWGVVRWSIRLPVLQVIESRRRPDGSLGDFVDTLVVALRDVGGEVVASGTGAGASAASGPRLRGTVFDSTSSAPLRGAMVTLEGLGRTVETDLNGQFVFDSLSEEGEIRLRAWHPRLDSLGLPALAARVSLRRRSETTTDLASGGIADVARQRCPRELRSAPRIIMGTLRSAADSLLAGSEVVLLERRRGAGGRDSLVRHVAITSDAGRYAFCNVQPGTQSWVLAREGTDWLSPRHVNGVEAPAVEVIALRGLAPDTATDSSRFTSAPVVILGRTLRDGPPQLAGWVLLPENSEARVQVLVDDVLRATAAPDGSFDVPDVAIGSHRVSFRAQGMATRHVLVAVETGQSALMVVALRVAPVVVVRGGGGPPPDLRLAGFYNRRRMGGGTFLDRADVERRSARLLSDMMRGVAGVRVVSLGSQMRYVSAHFRRMSQNVDDQSAGLCDMMLYIDGQPFQGDATSADARVRMTEVVGIEVYVSAASVPREFAGQSAACGVIVIWLGR